MSTDPPKVHRVWQILRLVATLMILAAWVITVAALLSGESVPRTRWLVLGMSTAMLLANQFAVTRPSVSAAFLLVAAVFAIVGMSV